MATTLTTSLAFALATRFVTDNDLSDPADALSMDWSDTLANGTGTDQADLIFHDRRTLVATSEDFDLAATLLDVYGSAITFVDVKGLFINNRNTTAGHTLSIGGAAGTQFVSWVGAANDEVNIGPNGLFVLWSPIDGYAVGAGASDLLKIDAGANTIIYDIVVIGTSA